MANASISPNSRLGTAVNPPAGPIQTVALADVNGNLMRTSDVGDGTSTIGGAMTLLAMASAARNGTTDTPTAAFNTAGISYAALDINLTAIASGTVTFSLQRLGADGIWYTTWSSAALAAPGANSYELGPSSPAAQLVIFATSGRLSWVFGGGAPPATVTFSASLIGR